MRELLLQIQTLIIQAAELASELPRGYREDQIKSSLTGTEGEFFGDGLPDWITELLKNTAKDDCDCEEIVS